MCLGGCEFQSSTVLIRTETAKKKKKKKSSPTPVSTSNTHDNLSLIRDPGTLEPFTYEISTVQQGQALGTRVNSALVRSASRMSGLCPYTGQLRETTSGREEVCFAPVDGDEGVQLPRVPRT